MSGGGCCVPRSSKKRHKEMPTFTVELYIYDMSNGLVKALSPSLLGKQIAGLWHTGIAAYNKEYYFGGDGVQEIQQGGTVLGDPHRKMPLGTTEIPYKVFLDHLRELSKNSYRPEKYDLFHHNCNTFSNDVAQFLTGHSIPKEITDLPQDILSTPLGAMLKPFLAQIGNIQSRANTAHTTIGAVAAGGIQAARDAHTSHSEAKRATAKKGNRNSNCAAQCPSVPAASDVYMPPRHLVERELLTYDTQSYSTEKHSLSSVLTAQQMNILDEVYEFISTPSCSWSLGRPHIAHIADMLYLDKLTNHHKAVICALLEQAVTNSDVVHLLRVEPNNMFVQLVSRSDVLHVDLQLGLARVIYTCCCDDVGFDWLMTRLSDDVTSFRSVVCTACVTWLLHQDRRLSCLATRIARIITQQQVDEHLSIELASALIQMTLADLDQRTADHVMISLHGCMKYNTQVIGLASVMGVRFENTSDDTSVSTCIDDMRNMMADVDV